MIGVEPLSRQTSGFHRSRDQHRRPTNTRAPGGRRSVPLVESRQAAAGVAGAAEQADGARSAGLVRRRPWPQQSPVQTGVRGRQLRRTARGPVGIKRGIVVEQRHRVSASDTAGCSMASAEHPAADGQRDNERALAEVPGPGGLLEPSSTPTPPCAARRQAREHLAEPIGCVTATRTRTTRTVSALAWRLGTGYARLLPSGGERAEPPENAKGGARAPFDRGEPRDQRLRAAGLAGSSLLACGPLARRGLLAWCRLARGPLLAWPWPSWCCRLQQPCSSWPWAFFVLPGLRAAVFFLAVASLGWPASAVERRRSSSEPPACAPRLLPRRRLLAHCRAPPLLKSSDEQSRVVGKVSIRGSSSLMPPTRITLRRERRRSSSHQSARTLAADPLGLPQ